MTPHKDKDQDNERGSGLESLKDKKKEENNICDLFQKATNKMIILTKNTVKESYFGLDLEKKRAMYDLFKTNRNMGLKLYALLKWIPSSKEYGEIVSNIERVTQESQGIIHRADRMFYIAKKMKEMAIRKYNVQRAVDVLGCVEFTHPSYLNRNSYSNKTSTISLKAILAKNCGLDILKGILILGPNKVSYLSYNTEIIININRNTFKVLSIINKEDSSKASIKRIGEEHQISDIMIIINEILSESKKATIEAIIKKLSEDFIVSQEENRMIASLKLVYGEASIIVDYESLIGGSISSIKEELNNRKGEAKERFIEGLALDLGGISDNIVKETDRIRVNSTVEIVLEDDRFILMDLRNPNSLKNVIVEERSLIMENVRSMMEGYVFDMELEKEDEKEINTEWIDSVKEVEGEILYRTKNLIKYKLVLKREIRHEETFTLKANDNPLKRGVVLISDYFTTGLTEKRAFRSLSERTVTWKLLVDNMERLYTPAPRYDNKVIEVDEVKFTFDSSYETIVEYQNMRKLLPIGFVYGIEKHKERYIELLKESLLIQFEFDKEPSTIYNPNEVSSMSFWMGLNLCYIFLGKAKNCIEVKRSSNTILSRNITVPIASPCLCEKTDGVFYVQKKNTIEALVDLRKVLKLTDEYVSMKSSSMPFVICDMESISFSLTVKETTCRVYWGSNMWKAILMSEDHILKDSLKSFRTLPLQNTFIDVEEMDERIIYTSLMSLVFHCNSGLVLGLSVLSKTRKLLFIDVCSFKKDKDGFSCTFIYKKSDMSLSIQLHLNINTKKVTKYGASLNKEQDISLHRIIREINAKSQGGINDFGDLITVLAHLLP
eukprot:GHVP01062210.1.p1 GENE.GHVP01062210.1~~GHVP01062210.1.p1  ORF type:complete len:835 (+),score=127.49 GHVP01062210.1:18-2522(+)